MTFLPVVGRELCAESRRPFNYWLRVIGAGALMIAAAMVLLPTIAGTSFGSRGSPVVQYIPAGFRIPGQSPFGAVGQALFGTMNATIFAAMWLLVPLLTADAISREKREGTLGLLFLTPLTSTGIVVGKGIVHALRALTLYFTMLPVLLMPLMLGGVTANDAIMAAMLDLGALLLALSAGLLATAWTRDWLKSVTVAIGLSLVFAVGFMVVQRAIVEGVLAGAAVPAAGWGSVRSSSYHGEGSLSWLRGLFALCVNSESEGPRVVYTASGPVLANSISMWGDIWSGYGAATHREWMGRTGVSVLLCGAVLVWALVVAGRSVERGWRDSPPSPQRRRVNEVLSRPVVSSGFLRQRMRRALERNPIGWLQQYSWNARLTKWGWCGFVILGELIFASSWRDAWDAQYWMAGLILFGVSFSAAGSFHRERETGAFELLLVTPLKPRQIIRGRLAGIRLQYLPAFATLLLAWACLVQPVWMRSLFQPNQWEHQFTDFVGLLAAATVSYLTLPVIGLFFSMRPMHQVVSWLCTCAVGLLIPALVFWNADLILGFLARFGMGWHLGSLRSFPGWAGMFVALSWQLLAALTAGALLSWSLARRKFILPKN